MVKRKKIVAADAEKKLMLVLWLEEFVRPLSNETAKILSGIGTNKELDTQMNILSAYTSYFLEKVIYDTLAADTGERDPEKEVQVASQRYALLKHHIQSGVASAFRRAFIRYTGSQDIDYYCQINPVPEPENKLPI
jgi:hypothetical protein